MTKHILQDNVTTNYHILRQIASDKNHPMASLLNDFKLSQFHRLAELKCGLTVTVNPAELLTAVQQVKHL